MKPVPGLFLGWRVRFVTKSLVQYFSAGLQFCVMGVQSSQIYSKGTFFTIILLEILERYDLRKNVLCKGAKYRGLRRSPFFIYDLSSVDANCREYAARMKRTDKDTQEDNNPGSARSS